jgi:haloacid dehalogenase superfamily, subfamily IA, variant 3 with third motif having DD or ED/haloacid dehalogenase superfamily, subfamily IA, variant 1 with third motif having Dx(3-4)D or Dx(3-4)E
MIKMLEDIDAVLFDMDGTLVDSMWVWVAVDEEYLERYNLTEPATFHEDMEGMSYREVAEYYHRVFPTLPMTVDEIMDEWHEMAYEKYMHEVPLKKGVKEFIEMVRKEGVKTGIATSNSRKLAIETLEALGISHLFDAVKTSEEAGAGKPAPDVYLLAAEKLKAEPSRCLVFEDVPAGIMAGKNAGMKVCAVKDDFSEPMAEKKRALADYYIEDYDDIKNGTYEVTLQEDA